MTNVLLEKKGHIAVATINRPKALNALNSQVLEDIDQLVEQVKADDEIRALVITGSGEKAFVAGRRHRRDEHPDQGGGRGLRQEGQRRVPQAGDAAGPYHRRSQRLCPGRRL